MLSCHCIESYSFKIVSLLCFLTVTVKIMFGDMTKIIHLRTDDDDNNMIV